MGREYFLSLVVYYQLGVKKADEMVNPHTFSFFRSKLASPRLRLRCSPEDRHRGPRLPGHRHCHLHGADSLLRVENHVEMDGRGEMGLG